MTLRFDHAEAWALMNYATEDRRMHERIWNSRDGVTPFVVLKDGAHRLTHVNFDHDVCSPAYIPDVGGRIFVDATIEDLTEAIAKSFERYISEDGTLNPDFASRWPGKSFREIVHDVAGRELVSHGEPPPHVVAVTFERREALIKTQDERVAAATAKGWAPPTGKRYA